MFGRLNHRAGEWLQVFVTRNRALYDAQRSKNGLRRLRGQNAALTVLSFFASMMSLPTPIPSHSDLASYVREGARQWPEREYLKDGARVPLFLGQTLIRSLRDLGYNSTTSSRRSMDMYALGHVLGFYR